MPDTSFAAAPGRAPEHGPDRAGLDRLLAIAHTDTGQPRGVADALLARRNAPARGGFDRAMLWTVEPRIPDDMLPPVQLIAQHGQAPTGCALEDAFAVPVKRWRPLLTQAVR